MVLLKLQKERVSLLGAQPLCCSSVSSFIPLHCPWSPALATYLLLGISSTLWVLSSSSLKKCSHRDSTLAVAIDDKVLPRWLSIKNLPTNAEDSGLIPGSERSPGGGNGYALQYSCLKNLKDRGAGLAVYSPWGRKRAKHDQTTTVHDNPLSFLLAIQQEFPSVLELLVSTSRPPVWFHLHNFSTWQVLISLFYSQKCLGSGKLNLWPQSFLVILFADLGPRI